MIIALLLERIAAQDPRRPAVFRGVRPVLDYGQLRDRVGRLAVGFLLARPAGGRSRGRLHAQQSSIVVPDRSQTVTDRP